MESNKKKNLEIKLKNKYNLFLLIDINLIIIELKFSYKNFFNKKIFEFGLNCFRKKNLKI